MANPLVSILIPSYNHANYVVETLNSIMVQDYGPIEVVVIDDGSKDSSVQVIQDYIKTQSNKLSIRFLHRENQGLAKTLNELIGLAHGQYLMFFASDDTLLPGCIRRLVELAEQQQLDAIVGDAFIIDAQGQRVSIGSAGQILRTPVRGKSFDKFIKWRTNKKFWFRLERDFGTYDSLLVSNYIPNGVLIRHDVIRTVGLFDPNLALQDHEYWLRLCRKYKISWTPDVLTNYRLHGENSIFRLSERILKDWMQILIREKEYCQTAKQKCLWYYAYTVLFIRALLQGNFLNIVTLLKKANLLVLLAFVPFVSFHKVTGKVLR